MSRSGRSGGAWGRVANEAHFGRQADDHSAWGRVSNEAHFSTRSDPCDHHCSGDHSAWGKIDTSYTFERNHYDPNPKYHDPSSSAILAITKVGLSCDATKEDAEKAHSALITSGAVFGAIMGLKSGGVPGAIVGGGVGAVVGNYLSVEALKEYQERCISKK